MSAYQQIPPQTQPRRKLMLFKHVQSKLWQIALVLDIFFNENNSIGQPSVSSSISLTPPIKCAKSATCLSCVCQPSVV